MFFFWIMAAISFAVGGYLWSKHQEISAWEWLGGAVVGLILAITFQIAAIRGMTRDVETLSGSVTEARYIPSWTERYTYYTTHYRRVGKVSTSYRVRHTGTRTHPERWVLKDTFGRDLDVGQGKYAEVQAKFGGKLRSEPGTRRTGEEDSQMIGGDANDVLAINDTRFIEPVTMIETWSNRVKAAPSVFSFPKVPKTVEVFPYPANPDPFVSERLLGTAATTFTALQWDQLNARLGWSKGVNLIAVGFGNRDSTAATWQEASWVGGKKNDLVLCYGGPNPLRPTWSKVFSWSESDECKYALQSILLEGLDATTLTKIETQVRANFTAKDWTKFDYLTVEPPTWAYVAYFLTVIAVQGGLYFWFFSNEHGKARPRPYRGYY